MIMPRIPNKLNEFQKNNEFYIKIFQKLESIKYNFFIKDIKYFNKLIQYIYNNDLLLLNKIDKRKKKDFSKKIFKTKLDIQEFCDENFITNIIIKNFEEKTKNKNKNILLITDFQKELIDRVVFLNYPYVFKKVMDYIKNNQNLKYYKNDIENRTIGMLIQSIIKYDLNSNNKFITYLSYWIRHGINEEIRIIKKNSAESSFIHKKSFTISDFQDKEIKTLLNYSMKLKDKQKFKKLLNQSFKKKFENMYELGINIFSIFNIDENKLTQSTLVKELNNMLRNKNNRYILFNYLTQPKIKKIFNEFNIEIQNNKVSLYKSINFIFFNNFYENTIPIFNIDEVQHHQIISNEKNIDDNDIFISIIKYLNKDEIKILNDFKNEEISDFPIKLKRKLEKLLYFNNDEEKILLINEK